VSDQELIDRYIEPDPYDPGPGRVRVRRYDVPVWLLVAHHQAVRGDADLVASAYDLPREAVDAAFAYYRRHQASIDFSIAEHDAGFVADPAVRRRQGIEAHERIIARRRQIEARTGRQPSSVDLIRELREGSVRDV
jgi:uncharacterized protein (DUF433 family)